MSNASNEFQNHETSWQEMFGEMLPEIERRLKHAFRNLREDTRAESTEEGVIHCLLAFAGLHGKGRAESVSPSSLVWYAVLHVKSGRPAVGRSTRAEPLSRYGQLANGRQIEIVRGDWVVDMVADKRASVFDLVATKVDVNAWLATLSSRLKEIAKDLAFGHSTSEVAEKHKLSRGRISQVRRSLEQSWTQFDNGRELGFA